MTTTIQSKVLTRTRHLPRILLGLLFLLPETLKLVAPFETIMSSYGVKPSCEPYTAQGISLRY
jgi:hypothetical protein